MITRQSGTAPHAARRWQSRHIGLGRSSLAALLLIAAVCALTCDTTSADDSAAGVDDARATIEKWVETRRIISQEQRDWDVGREMLLGRIELVQNEIESLRDKIDEANRSVTDADKTLADLVAENDTLKEGSMALTNTVAALEARTRELLPRLPEPIRQRVKPLSQQLPDASEDTRIGLAERYMNVVGILDNINKFDREITVTSEVRTLPDGTSVEVKAVYLGISMAYYVKANDRVAGSGTASDDGWMWTPANEDAPAIAHIISILQNEQPASFVRVPIEIK